ncbi:methylated-DNA--[protein]-cysteine S-methyltransferase [bacterium]|nr:MAG: methylated-DNA--[protein]-cysteine S-methyltransferase [bacterium]
MRTPLGEVVINGTGKRISLIHFAVNSVPDSNSDATTQLSEYFAGQRINFNLKLAPEGTLFQKQVWEEMQKIPFGETATYADIAKRVGRPEAWRAVANACGKNPIVIAIPCHRVVGSHGKLGGYSGGIERKQWLLQHEAAVLSRISRK